jgi:hypothetical protein
MFSLTAFDVARFWSRVEVRKADQCWPWRYGLTSCGYGEFRFEGRGRITQPAPRAAYWLAFGDIPDGKVIRHTCDNQICCNPAHLEAGTHADNVADRVKRDRSAIGEENGKSKLREDQVMHIRQSRFSDKRLAAEYGIHEDTVRQIRRGETWKHC